MSMYVCAVTALAVALLHSTWRDYFQRTLAHQRQLRERVTYMLWVMANKGTDSKPLSLPEL